MPSSSFTARQPRRSLWVLLGLVLATALLYSQTATFEFTTYDDPLYVTANEHVLQGWTSEAWRWAWTTAHATNWHPLTWLSHLTDVELFGRSAAGPHVVNVLLHAGSVALLFGLLFRHTGHLWRSALVAALFAFHPLRVESVAWIAERKDVLSAFWTLAALSTYAEFVHRGGFSRTEGRRMYFAALASTTLALLAKPMAVTIPFLLLLLDLWPLARARTVPRSSRAPTPVSRLLLEKVPFALLALICAAATWVVQYRGGAMQAAVTIPFADRMANALVSPAWYLWKLTAPIHLSPLYIHPSLPGGTPWAAWHIVVSTLLLVAVSILVFRERTRGYPVVGWLWYLGMLLPVLGLVQVGGQAAADRYTYLPSVGILLLVVRAISDLRDRIAIARKSPLTRISPVPGAKNRTAGAASKGVIAVAIFACAGAVALTWKQTQVWRNSESLYRHALASNPDNMLMHNNLALVLAAQGKAAEAETHFREALRILPTYRQAAEGLAQLLADRGANAEAIELLRTAARLRPGRGSGNERDPDRARVLLHLGTLLLAEGRHDEAGTVLAQAAAIDPGLSGAETQRGQALESEGKQDAARLAYECALAIDPRNPEASYNLGNLLVKAGALEDAAARYEVALRQRPDFALARNNLGWTLLQLGRARDARPHFEEALRLDPGWELPLRNLAWILATDPDPALREAARAVELAEKSLRSAQPATAVHFEVLGAAYAAAGEFQRAMQVAEDGLRGAAPESAIAGRLREQLARYRQGRLYTLPPTRQTESP